MAAPTDLVVVLHGISSHSLVMAPLGARLRGHNFRVRHWGYASVVGPVARHAQNLRDFLTGELAHEPRVHVVAHSMGSIVARSALAQGAFPNLGRVVLLAPPNQGSPVARVLASLFGRMCRPLADLSDAAGSYVNSLPALESIELGVLAARYDVLVPTASTHLAGAREHLLLSATHNSLLFSRRVANLVAAFLDSGTFAAARNR